MLLSDAASRRRSGPSRPPICVKMVHKVYIHVVYYRVARLSKWSRLRYFMDVGRKKQKKKRFSEKRESLIKQIAKYSAT